MDNIDYELELFGDRECARCGATWLPLHKHHTYLRQNSDETIDLCYKCHHWVHMNIAEAEKHGWMKQFGNVKLNNNDDDGSE